MTAQRTDNTIAMARVGRLLLTIVVIVVWAAMEIGCGVLVAAGFGVFAQSYDFGITAVGLAGNAFFSFLTAAVLRSIWLGPEKVKDEP